MISHKDEGGFKICKDCGKESHEIMRQGKYTNKCPHCGSTNRYRPLSDDDKMMWIIGAAVIVIIIVAELFDFI
jgi:uncharacterized membrane protein YvbJ